MLTIPLGQSSLGLPRALALLVALAAPTAAAAETPVLELERELSLSLADSARLALDLEAGQYFWLWARAEGADVAVALRAPSGKVVEEVDARHEPGIAEDLCWIAGETGRYLVEVRGTPPSGHHELRIKLEELRLEKPGDREQIPAWKAYAEARGLQLGRKELRRAIELYEGTLPVWREVEDFEYLASTLDNVGFCHRLLEEVPRAVERFEEALPHWRAAGAVWGEANTWINLAEAQLYLDRFEPAAESYRRSLALSRKEGAPRFVKLRAVALQGLATLEQQRGQLDQARERLLEAVELFERLGDRRALAGGWNSLGTVETYRGDFEAANEALDRALAMAREVADRRLEAAVLSNLAVLRDWSGKPLEALLHHRSSLEINREEGVLSAQAEVLRNLGGVYLSLGDLRQALTSFQEAHRLNGELIRPADRAEALSNVGWTHTLNREPARGIFFLETAVETLREVGEPTFLAAALEKLGRSLQRAGDSKRASVSLQEALELSRALGRPRREGRILLGLGELLESKRDSEGANESFRGALTLSQQAGEILLQIEALVGLARCERAAGRLPAAQEHLEAALSQIESVRAQAGGLGMRASFLATKRSTYELAIDIAMERHRLEPGSGYEIEAFKLHQRALARSLLDSIVTGDFATEERVPAELLREERSLRYRLGALELRLEKLGSAAHERAQARQLRQEQAQLVRRHGEVEGQLRASLPEAFTSAELTFEPARIREDLLDDETALLVYALGEGRSFAWVVTEETFKVVELPERSLIEAAVGRAHRLLSQPAEPDRGMASKVGSKARADSRWLEHPALRSLSELVLQPVASLAGSRRLAIVADGALWAVPFGALPVPRPGGAFEPLLARREVVYVPSPAVLATARRYAVERPRAERALAILADAVYGPPDPRLPTRVEALAAARAPAEVSHELTRSTLVRLEASAREAEAIAALLPAREVLVATGFEATRDLVVSGQLEPYRALHLATHGHVHPYLPELSSLTLSRFDALGSPRDGALRLQDVRHLRLRAELVVLSACETALGHDVAGEGPVGLARGFLEAGPPRVIASLWQVHDEATADLMADFYRHALGQSLPASAALREAQLAIWRDSSPPPRHPYFWAAFAFYGDWR